MCRNDSTSLGRDEAPPPLCAELAGRHGLIAGAPGAGRTASLQAMAEGFSARGIPVFAADLRGDLSGISQPGTPTPAILQRAAGAGVTYAPAASPTTFWDPFGEEGHPIRATVIEMGPLLLARMLGLNVTQEAVLATAFRIADDQGLLLLDLRDLRALLHVIGEGAQELALQYGRLPAASVNAIQRRLTTLERQGGRHLFGEPALAIDDLVCRAPDGRGVVHVLAARSLMIAPKLYGALLLWLLAELLEALPDMPDPGPPALGFLFDEAQLLFQGAPPALLGRLEQLLGRILAKGVVVVFVAPSLADVPGAVLAQLGTRIQHAPSAPTPRDRQALLESASIWPFDPADDPAAGELRPGEALIATALPGGAAAPLERRLLAPPASRLGPASTEERRRVLAASPLAGRYDAPLERAAARRLLAERTARGCWRRASISGGERPAGRRADDLAQRLASGVLGGIGRHAGGPIARGLMGSLRRRDGTGLPH